MAYCNSLDCTPIPGTPLGLSDVLGVMAIKWIVKVMQCSNWTMDNALSQKAREYEMCDAYVIWHVGDGGDQRLRAVYAPQFTAWLSTCSAFWRVLLHG